MLGLPCNFPDSEAAAAWPRFREARLHKVMFSNTISLQRFRRTEDRRTLSLFSDDIVEGVAGSLRELEDTGVSGLSAGVVLGIDVPLLPLLAWLVSSVSRCAILSFKA